MPQSFVKDPNSILDYKWDWSAWLAAGDTISTSNVTVTAGDVSINSQSNTTTSVTAFVSGGTLSSEAKLTSRVVTAQGRTDDRTITLKIQDT